MAGSELKKHVGAVHVKGRLSLLQRKVSNVLLYHAYEELPDTDITEHAISLKEIAEVTGFESNDHQMLRDVLEALVDLKIKWNILDSEGEEEWGVSSFLAQAVTKGGMCKYAYSPDLRRKLYNPEIYARINLSVQERFGSSYGLALYENCVRFRRTGSTGWITIEQWRNLLGVDPGRHEQFKYFNRDVLKPAIEEINRFSDIRIEMQRRRKKRKIVALKFIIEERELIALGQATGTERDDLTDIEEARVISEEESVDGLSELGPIEQRLMTFGLSEVQAQIIVQEYEHSRILGNLDYVKAELERGRAISNVPAFTLGAIRADYRPRETEVEREVRQSQKAKKQDRSSSRKQQNESAAQAEAERLRAEEQARIEAKDRAKKLDEMWDRLTEVQKAHIQGEVLIRLKKEVPFVFRLYQQERKAERHEEEMSIAVRSTLRGFRYDILEETQSVTD